MEFVLDHVPPPPPPLPPSQLPPPVARQWGCASDATPRTRARVGWENARHLAMRMLHLHPDDGAARAHADAVMRGYARWYGKGGHAPASSSTIG